MALPELALGMAVVALVASALVLRQVLASHEDVRALEVRITKLEAELGVK